MFNYERKTMVPAFQLSLDDAFMKHIPRTEAELKVKNLVETAIKSGVKDFWLRLVCDPAFNADDSTFCEPDKKPAMSKNYNWWEEEAKKYNPASEKRICSDDIDLMYSILLAKLIKELVASGKSVDWAWNAVCNDSNELGHYRNFSKANVCTEDRKSKQKGALY